MVLIAVEASPVGSKPPAAVDERISKDGRHGFGDASPLSTRAFVKKSIRGAYDIVRYGVTSRR